MNCPAKMRLTDKSVRALPYAEDEPPTSGTTSGADPTPTLSSFYTHARCALLAALVLLSWADDGRADVSRIGSWTTGLSHAPGPGTDRLLVLITSMEDTVDHDITSVTYGGQAMTQVVELVNVASPYSRCEAWVLDETGLQAASGSSFFVTHAGSPTGSFDTAHAAATFQGVDQSAPVSGSAANTTQSGTTISTLAFAVGPGGLSATGAVHGSSGSYSDAAWGAAWVEGSDQARASMTLGTANTITPYPLAGTDAATATHTVSANRQVIVAVGLAATTSTVDLEITKAVDIATPRESSPITYTLTLANSGPGAATGVAVTDLLPGGVTYVSHTVTRGSYTSGSGLWTVGTVATAASDTLTIDVTVDTGTGGSTILNTGSVTAVDQVDPTPANNSDTASITILTELLLVKRCFLPNGTPVPSGSTLRKGQAIRYLIYINNRGPAQTDVSVQDVLDPTFAYQVGTLRVDNSVAACASDSCAVAEEAAIFSSVAVAPAATDAVDGDTVSYAAGASTLDVGNQHVGNAQLDVAANAVWAMLFEVTVQ